MEQYEREHLNELREKMAANEREHESFRRRLKEHDERIVQINDLTLAVQRQGDVMEVLCEGFDGQSMLFVGRSYAESPDIDGRIYFSTPRDVAAGEFVPVRITSAMDGELTGELAEE